MPVGTGAGAATARLDAEQVVEQGHDRQALRVGIAQDLEVGVGLPAVQRTAPEALLACLDQVGADRLLEPHDQPGTDRLDDRWRSEEHTSELQSRGHLVCRLLLEKKKNFSFICLIFKIKTD